MISQQRSAREIFTDLIAHFPADQWLEQLGSACHGNETLRRRVQALLKAHLDKDSLPIPPAEPLETVNRAITERPGDRIGRYKLLQQIGEGGFGIVYMAEQERPVRRKVALKIIKPGMDTKEVIARFESERQALALMDHPNIAKVLDAGATDSGRPYFVMELVRGITITDYCDENHLSIEDRLQLFIQVCHAVQHAHQKGIIHRDLKPSNVMVTLHDGRPVPKVIDFGVAKATCQQLTDKTLFTAYGQMIGTPAYMSPEQAELSGLDIDTRSDVYSLGVLLYELLTGTTPFDSRTLRSAGFDEMRRIIREEEPETVSARIARTRRGAGVSPAQKNEPTSASDASPHASTNNIHAASPTAGLRPPAPSPQPRAPRFSELDWIATKSLEKDRERRYESPLAFARDIERYLSDKPVQACPPSAAYRFRKFAAKHRMALTSGTIIAASLLIGIVVSTTQTIRASAAEAQATANETKAKAEEQKALAAAASERAAKETEATQRKQAERNFEAALDAVERMLANSYDETLRDIPRVQLLQRKLLQDAMAFFERLPREGISIDARFRIGSIWSDIARLWHNLRDMEQAKFAWETAAKDLNQVIEMKPNHSTYVAKLVHVETMLGWVCANDLKQLDEGEKHHRRQLELCVLMAREEPEEKGWLSGQAAAWGRLAVMFNAAGNREKAIDASRQSLRLLEQANASGDQLGRQMGLLAIFLARTDPEEAESLFRRAIAIYRAYIRQDKEFKSLRRSYAETLQSAASFFEKRHPEEVEALLDEGIAVMRDELARPISATKKFFDLRFRLILDHQASFLRRLAHKSGVDPQQARQHLAKAQSLRQELIEVQRQMVAFDATETSRFTLIKSLQEESLFQLSPAAVPISDPPSTEGAPRVLADAMLTEAIQLCRILAAEFPGNGDYRSRLADLEKLHAQHFGQPLATETSKDSKAEALKGPSP